MRVYEKISGYSDVRKRMSRPDRFDSAIPRRRKRKNGKQLTKSCRSEILKRLHHLIFNVVLPGVTLNALVTGCCRRFIKRKLFLAGWRYREVVYYRFEEVDSVVVQMLVSLP
jgi:hypothetical protein